MTEVLQATDVVEIAQVAALYGHIFDAREWMRLPELFTSDGVFEVKHVGIRSEGIERIREFVSSVRHPLGHHSTNLHVYESGGAVRARSKWFVPSDQGVFRGGDYADVWVRNEAGWRLRERVVLQVWAPVAARADPA